MHKCRGGELQWKDRRRREDSIGKEMKNSSCACVVGEKISMSFFIIEGGGASKIGS